jgi:hypothetical protein
MRPFLYPGTHVPPRTGLPANPFHGIGDGLGGRRMSRQRGQASSATTGSQGSPATTSNTMPLPKSMRSSTELKNVRPTCVEKVGLIGGL